MSDEEKQPARNSDKKPPKENSGFWGSFFREQLLLWVQLGVCVLAVAAFMIMKAIGGSWYAAAATWYFDQYNDSVMTTEQEKALFFRDEISVTESSCLTYTPVKDSRDNLPPTAVLPVQGGKLAVGFDKNGKGVELSVSKGSRIMAVLDGTVTATGENETDGRFLVLDHTNGIQTRYLHCGKLTAEKGTRIMAGEVIGLTDRERLGFELLENGIPVDPQKLLKGA